jgi:tetratricopeptide (TPR) repeat protein
MCTRWVWCYTSCSQAYVPFDTNVTLRKAGYAEIQRIIREVDPPRPSTTRLSSMVLRLSKLKDTSVQQVAGFYNREAWTLLADVGVSLADALKAEMMAERAIRIWNDQELDPDSNHLNTLGLAYLRTGRFQDSIEVLALASTLLMQRTSGERARSEDSLFSAIAHANLGNVQEAERMRVKATEVGSWSINERLRDALFDELNVAISRSRDAKTPSK